MDDDDDVKPDRDGSNMSAMIGNGTCVRACKDIWGLRVNCNVLEEGEVESARRR